MAGGKLFQMIGPATVNDLSPYVDLARGTWSIQVSADLIPISGATVASLSAEVSQLRRDLTIQALVDKRCQLERDSLTDG